MKFETSLLEGCALITLEEFHDSRGSFTKIYNEAIFKEYGINTVFKEQFFSTSHKNVLRGMHYQSAPFEHCKLIVCMSGSVLDVVLDTRKDSPTFGQSTSFFLEEGDGKAVFIPEGMAHGFLSLQENTVLMYAASSEQEKSAEGGILWNSFGFDWTCDSPTLSERDMSHESFETFKHRTLA